MQLFVTECVEHGNQLYYKLFTLDEDEQIMPDKIVSASTYYDLLKEWFINEYDCQSVAS